MEMGMVSPDKIPLEGYTHEYLFKQNTRFKPKAEFHSPMVRQLGSFGENGIVYQFIEWKNGNRALLVSYADSSKNALIAKTNYELVTY